MPAPKIFLSSEDIAEFMGISRREAQYLLTMFEKRGQIVRNGRVKLVSVGIFSIYLSAQDGQDPSYHKNEIKDYLREKRAA